MFRIDRSALLLLASLLSIAPTIAGCSGSSSSEGDAANMTEGPGAPVADGVDSNLLGTVTAVRIDDLRGIEVEGTLTAVVAEQGKVARILEATGLDRDSSLPRKGAGKKCMPNYMLTFMNSSGESIASAGFLCGSGDTDEVAGTLTFDGTTYRLTGNITEVNEVANAPRLVGDVLYGIDEIAISHPRKERTVETTDAGQISEILAAVPRDQEPEVRTSWEKCPPDVAIEFRRGSETVASVSYICGAEPEGIVIGKFTAQYDDEAEVLGGILVDATLIAEIESSLEER